MKNIRVIAKNLIEVVMTKPVGGNAAALSYWLTLSIFPFLICVTVILSSLNIQETAVFGMLQGAIPEPVFDWLHEHLSYIGTLNRNLILLIGITAMLTSSSAAFRTFTHFIGEVQGEVRFIGIKRIIISFLFSVIFLAVIYGSAIVLLFGEWFIHLFDPYFQENIISELVLVIRFAVVFLLLFSVIYIMYLLTSPPGKSCQPRIPGAIAASIALIIASVIYSQLISISIRFQILYGSLASFIILLIWLHTCSIILIMANVLNISIGKMRSDEREKENISEELLET